MVTLPCLQKQNKIANKKRYGVKKLSTVLSEMQTGNANQRQTI